jgi:hypothetical protein
LISAILFPWCTSLTASDRDTALQSLPSFTSPFFGSYKFYGTLQHRNMSINNSLAATSGNTQQIQMPCRKEITSFSLQHICMLLQAVWYKIWAAVASTSDGNIMWLTEVITSYYNEGSHKIIAH